MNQFGPNANLPSGYQPNYLLLSNLRLQVSNKPIFIIGGGPSAKSFDMDSIQDQQVIAVNHAMHFFKQPHHILYYGDRVFENKMKDEIVNHPSLYKFTKLNTKITNKTFELSGNNSGTQAIVLADYLNPSVINLIGFDMQVVDGQTHWHGRNFSKPIPEHYKEFKESFNQVLKTIKAPVVNKYTP